MTLPVAAWAAGLVGAVIVAGCGFDDLGVVACPSRLLPGQLVITEIMPDPGSDTGEWIEIFNATDQAVDLRGVVLAVEGGGEALQRHAMRAARIAPRAYFVLGRDSAVQAAAPIDYVYGEALDALPDGGGRVTLRCDVITVDLAEYPGAAPGVAVGLSGALLPDALSNDEPARWCAAQLGFAPGRAGSPGAANEACAGTPGESPGSGMCEHDGGVREVVAPVPGDLVITEVMANPAAVPDDAGEWLELYVERDVDLDGLSVGTEPGALRVVIADGACVRAAAGSHVVLAASADPAGNGGLGAIAGELDLGLRNTGGTLMIGHGSAVLDEITWASAPAGRSLALDPAHRSPAANDVAAHWCASTAAPYGSGDIGTPGAANGACGEAPGDPPGDAGLPGDAGMPGDAAPPVPLCSDGDTGVMRPIMSPAPDSVRITEIMADSRAVADSDGEWIEVRFDVAADLNGVELGKVPGQVLVTIEAPQCLAVAAGGHAVLARTIDPDRNGGLLRVDAVFGFGLVNGGGTLFVGTSGAVLDHVSHGEATPGASASLDEGDDSTWCTSPADAVYGRGDRGTPGALNPACAEPAPAPGGKRARPAQ